MTSKFKVFFPGLINKLFFRILVYFLSLLFPIIIIGSIFYFQFTEKLKDDFTDKILINLRSSVQTMDIYLQTTQETTMSFMYDDSVIKLLKPYDLYSLEERANLTKITGALKRVSGIITEFIDQIFVFVDTDKVYTYDGLDSFDVFFNSKYKFKNYNSDFWKSKLNSNLPVEILAPSSIETLYGQTKLIVPILTTRIIQGHNTVIGISISAESIQRILANNSIFSSSRFIVLDNNDQLLMANEGLQTNPAWIDQLIDMTRDESIQSLEMSFEGEQWILAYAKSELYGWTYLSMTPVEQFKLHTEDIIKMIIMLCLVLMVIGIVFSFVFTVNLYSPIKKIRDILTQQDKDSDENNQSLVIDEIDQINFSLHQLLDPKSGLKNQLNMIKMEYIDHALNQIIRGNPPHNEREFRSILEEEFNFGNDNYMCCILSFNFKSRFYEKIQDTDRITILSKMKRILWGLLNDHIRVYVLEYQPTLYVCLIDVQNEIDKVNLLEGLNNIIQTFQYDSQYCQVRIGIGKMYEGINGIMRSYSDAMTAIEHANDQNDFQIIDCEKLDIRDHMHYSYNDENVIILSLQNGNIEKLAEKVHEIVQTNKEQGISHLQMHVLISEMYQTGLRFLTSKMMNGREFISEEDHRILTNTGVRTLDIQIKVKHLLHVYQLMVEQATNFDSIKIGSSVSNMIKYIEEHYHQDLYLEKIAEEVGGSSKYLSRLFKEKTGVNLTDYINLFRIIKAKDLLINTDITVGEIAVQVGIFSRSTFLRLFKKYEGVSPNDYRNINRQ